MSRSLTLVALVACASPAWADIIPDEVATCQGRKAGAACTTPDGAAGTCVEMTYSRLDYSDGIPPKLKAVKALGCQASATASAKVSAGWWGVGLAFLAAALGLATRPRRGAPLPA